MTRSRLRSRLLLALVAGLAALVAADLLFRLWAPPTRPGTGVFYAPNGQQVPLGEIVHFLTRMSEFNESVNAEIEQPHGLLQANLRLSMGYHDPKPRWDYFDENGCIAVDTNELGFRDLPFPVQKPAAEFRVLALGDSFTYGQGVRLDLTWPQVMEQRLHSTHGHPVEVINAGFASGPGVNSPDGYDRWLEQHGIHFSPDVVVVGLCLNDLGDVPLLSYPVVQMQPVLGGFSRLLDHLVWSQRQRAARREHLDVCGPVHRQPAAWQGTQRGLLAMQQFLRARGLPLVVAVFPMLSQLDDYPYAELHDLVVKFCGEHRIRCVDLRHAFDGMVETDLWVHQGDQHPNHTGHAIMAARIEEYLAQQGLIPGG